MRKPQIPVAKEGYPFIFLAAFITLVFAFLESAFFASIGMIITIFVLSFFRDPERFIPEKEHAVTSPADGKILFVKKIHDETYLHQEAFKISIFMNIFNVHVNRTPVAGSIEKIIYTPGKFYSADSEQGEFHNENCAIVMINANGSRIAFVQVAGLIARRIVNWLDTGDVVQKGQRCGLIRFGSRVDVYLPADAVIAVEAGQKVCAGETVLGYLNI